MVLSGLLNSSLIVTIGITMLLSSVIVYYCNSRFVSLEKGVHRQNQVLAEFIANVQGELRNSSQRDIVPSGPVMHNITTQEAINSAKKYYETDVTNDTKSIEIENKIEVSDDENSSTSSNEDSDSGSESESESDNEREKDNANNSIVCVEDLECSSDEDSTALQMTSIMNLMPLNRTMDIKVIAMTHNSSTELTDIAQILEHSFSNIDSHLPITELDNLEVISSDSDNDTSDEEESNSLKMESVNINVEKKDEFSVLENIQQVNNNIDYKKMNVSALKELVAERGLSSNSEIKKMKKTDLIDVLSK